MTNLQLTSYSMIKSFQILLYNQKQDKDDLSHHFCLTGGFICALKKKKFKDILVGKEKGEKLKIYLFNKYMITYVKILTES